MTTGRIQGFWSVLFPAVWALTICSCQGDDGGTPSGFLARIQDSDPAVRIEAAGQAAEQGIRVVGPLADLMATADPEVRATASEALWQIARHVTYQPQWPGQRRMVAEAFLSLLDGSRPLVVRRQALAMLALVGDERAAGPLAALLDDPALADDARRTLMQIPGPVATEALIQAMETCPPEERAGLIQAMGRRQDPQAIPALLSAYHQAPPEEADRILAALAEIGEPAGEVLSLGVIRRAEIDALNRWGPLFVRYAERRAQRGHVDEALRICQALLAREPKPPLCVAVLRLVGEIGGPAEATWFLPYLVSASPEVAGVAHQALVRLKDPPPPGGIWQGWIRKNPSATASTVSARLLRMYAFAEPAKKAALLRVIADRGMPEAQQLILQALSHPAAVVRQSALRVMREGFDGQDPAALALFLEAARTDPGARAEAVDGCLGYADFLVSIGHRPEALSLYHEMLTLAEDLEARRRCLAGITRLADPSSTEVIQVVCAGELAVEAADAAIAIAEALAAEQRTEEAAAVLRRTVACTSDVQAGRKLGQALARLGIPVDNLAAESGYISRWWIIGPFPASEDTAVEQDYFPQARVDLDAVGYLGFAAYRWKPATVTDIPAVMRLSEQLGPVEDAVAYAYAELISPQEQEARLAFRCDDGLVVWLNGQKIYSTPRPCRLMDQAHETDVVLCQGSNHLLIKSLQQTGEWAFVVRLLDSAGNPLSLPPASGPDKPGDEGSTSDNISATRPSPS